MADLTPEQQATLDRWRNFLDDNGTLVTTGFVGDPNSAYHFFRVIDGQPVRHPCPIGYIFNPQRATCDLAEDVSVDVNPAPRDAPDRPTEVRLYSE